MKITKISVLAVWFILTPSPEAKIGVNQQAHYQCSVDHPDVNIVWFVNGTGSGDNSIIQLGIVTIGAGSSNSSLTIPGSPQYNNTVVRCNAFGSGIINGSNYINTTESTLRIQGNTLSDICMFSIIFLLGKLTKVRNLVCKRQQHTCATCTWSPPFSLVPISGYIVNVTEDFSGEKSKNITADTTWTFCISPSQFNNYTISVAGNNTTGEGEINTMTIEINTGEVKNNHYCCFIYCL